MLDHMPNIFRALPHLAFRAILECAERLSNWPAMHGTHCCSLQWADVTPERYVYVLIPRTCKCDFIWKKNLCRCNQIKDLDMRLSWNI